MRSQRIAVGEPRAPEEDKSDELDGPETGGAPTLTPGGPQEDPSLNMKMPNLAALPHALDHLAQEGLAHISEEDAEKAKAMMQSGFDGAKKVAAGAVTVANRAAVEASSAANRFGGATDAPSSDELLRACAHPDVTVEKLQDLGPEVWTEAAAKKQAEGDNTKAERETEGKIVKGATALHCICMNESVKIEMLQAVHKLWKEAAKEKTAVRLGSLRAQMSSRRVTTLSIASSTERIHASALHLHQPERHARDAERGG